MSILCYHAVDPFWKSPLAISPPEFEAHLTWLARSRTVVPLEVALQRMDRRGRLPRGMVALTFDDGFAQLRDLVFPKLARYGMPATVFLVAQTLSPHGQTVDWVDTPPAWPLATLDANDVLAARDDGVAFASHSWAHRTLTDLDEDACRTDLANSREYLGDLLHQKVPFLAYPRGRHDQAVRRAAADVGYSYSLALPEHHEHMGPHSVPRVGVFPGNGVLTLRAKTHPSYLSLRHSAAFPILRAAVRRP